MSQRSSLDILHFKTQADSESFIRAVSKQFPGLKISAPISLTKSEAARTAEVLAGEFPKEGIVLIRQHPDDENNLGYVEFSEVLLNEIAKSLVTHFGFRFVYVDFQNFSIAVKEAVKNAIVWGNEYQPGKIFGIHWKLGEDWTFYVDVLDEGKAQLLFAKKEPGKRGDSISLSMAGFGRGHVSIKRFLRSISPLQNSRGEQVGNAVRLALTYRSELRAKTPLQTGIQTDIQTGARHQNEGQATEPSDRSELRTETKTVTIDVAQMIFRISDAITLGRSELRRFLTMQNPAAYAETPRENYVPLFADQKLAANAINQLIIVLKEIPEKHDPYVQVLSDILGANSLSKARIIVPGAARDEILKANRELRIRNLVISGRDENLPSLIQSYAGRTLVYDFRDEVLQAIENKRDTLKQPSDILLVEDDATIENQALALLNAIEFLNEKKDLRSFGVVSAMGLLQLTENLNIRNRAELRLEQAA